CPGVAAGQRGVALVEGAAAPERVDRAPAPHRQQPTGRIAGHAIARPGDERLGQRLLGEVLGQGEVAGVAGERTGDPGCPAPPHRGDLVAGCAHSWPVDSRHARSRWIHSLSCGNSSMLGTRRISVFMPGPASGARLAHSTASSLEATSRIQKPPNSSLVSPYAPPVVTGGWAE